MVKITNVDYIFRDIIHSNISIEYGIEQCRDGHEVGMLMRLLAECGELDEEKYNSIMYNINKKGKLDKFMSKE